MKLKNSQRNWFLVVLAVIGVGLFSIPAESVVLRHGGLTNVLTAPATGGNLDGTDATLYTFAEPVGGAYVQIHPDSTATLYVKWNPATGVAASTTNWDTILVAGGIEFAQMEGDISGGIPVKTVSIISAVAQTLGTNFVVKGIAIQ